MTSRYEYTFHLANITALIPPAPLAELELRTIQLSDAPALAELMIDSYRGTIDYDGETLEDALGEISAYLAGERGGQPLPSASYLAFADGRLAGVCLAGDWQARQLPLISYVMTSAEWKHRGIGQQVLWATLQALSELGYGEVRAVITEGNTPSERLFARMGFQRV